ncbi:hypothetical protein K438DRAFT_385112 [Mycena galopus ATCC 62051]|nr:hypothetical protein K438DRAFT_385112 [Mycena galopus ATCC 62051]
MLPFLPTSWLLWRASPLHRFSTSLRRSSRFDPSRDALAPDGVDGSRALIFAWWSDVSLAASGLIDIQSPRTIINDTKFSLLTCLSRASTRAQEKRDPRNTPSRNNLAASFDLGLLRISLDFTLSAQNSTMRVCTQSYMNQTGRRYDANTQMAAIFLKGTPARRNNGGPSAVAVRTPARVLVVPDSRSFSLSLIPVNAVGAYH